MKTFLIAAALLAVIAWRVPRRLRGNLVLLLITTIVALFAAEMVLGWTHTTDVEQPLTNAPGASGAPRDTRPRLAIVDELRKQGVQAYPSVPAQYLMFKPLAGLTLDLRLDGQKALPLANLSQSVVVYCNEAGPYTVSRTDEHGFLNPPGIFGRDRIELAVVGDSFVQAGCLPQDLSFAAWLRRQYPNTLNLGHGGYGPLMTLAALKEYLPALRPSRVVWAYYEGNDLINLEEEGQDPRLLAYLEQGHRQHLAARQAEVDQAMTRFLDSAIVLERAQPGAGEEEASQTQAHLLPESLRDVLVLSHLRALLPAPRREPAIAGPRREVPCCDLQLLEKVLEEARATVQSWGGEITFVYLPGWERFGLRRRERWSAPVRAHDEVLALVRKMGFPIIDVTDAFQKHDNPLAFFYYRGSHYNVGGARLAAETVLSGLSSGH